MRNPARFAGQRILGRPGPAIASAARLTRRQFSRIRTLDWQKQAWEYYDTLPELRYVANWLGQACSQARLYVGRVDPDGSSDPAPVTDNAALVAPLRALYGGYNQQPEMLRRMAVQLTICGESFLVHGTLDDGREVWHTATADEFDANANTRRLKLEEGEYLTLPEAEGDDDTFVIRIWTPHPARAWEADAPTRALLTVCAELKGLSQHLAATIDSRLAGAGVMTLSEDAFLPAAAKSPDAAPPPGDDDGLSEDDGTDADNDPFLAAFAEAMITPIADRDNAAAVVPIIIRASGSVKDAFRYDTFATPLSADIVTLRENAVKRFASGADVPAEVLLGLSDVNHWNAWQISSDSVTIHVEPLMSTICDALTSQYYAPLISGEDADADDQYALWFETSRLVNQSDRVAEALEMYDRGLLKGDRAVQAAGWGADDMPTLEERTDVLITQLAKAGVDPATAAPWLTLLGITSTAVQAAAPAPISPDPAAPDIIEGTVETAPAITASATTILQDAGAILLAAHACTLRALEIAGKRLLSSGARSVRHQHGDTAAWSLHTKIPYRDTDVDHMLKGAFALADEIFGNGPARANIELHVRSALARRETHSVAVLRRRLFGLGGRHGRCIVDHRRRPVDYAARARRGEDRRRRSRAHASGRGRDDGLPRHRPNRSARRRYASAHRCCRRPAARHHRVATPRSVEWPRRRVHPSRDRSSVRNRVR